MKPQMVGTACDLAGMIATAKENLPRKRLPSHVRPGRAIRCKCQANLSFDEAAIKPTWRSLPKNGQEARGFLLGEEAGLCYHVPMGTRRNTGRSIRLLGLLLAALLALIPLGLTAFSCSPQASSISSDAFDEPQISDTDGEASAASASVISIDMVGDVNLADGWATGVADAHDGQAAAAFSPEILEHLVSADIFYANHEFTMSSRGEALSKYYTFRADPSMAAYWKQLGVDVVGLANNHAYDYGEEAFLDTLDILESNGIRHVGAGRDLSEAMAPVAFGFDGYTVAFVAADRSQKGDEVRAAAANDDAPGVLFCFDETLFVQAVAEATEQADFVIAVPHWGIENSTALEEEQILLAQKLIDAGADAVIGSHPHVLQGMEYYQGKLIAYSLGNFWFNWETVQTLVLNIEIVNGEPSYRIIPALQTEQQVITSEQISAEVIQDMRLLSPGLDITDEGVISEGP